MVRASLLVLAGGSLLVGCAGAPRELTVRVPAGEYARAFEAARDVASDMRLPLDRVDAAQGVLTTGPRFSSGFATPWDRTQTSALDEVDDFLNHQSRQVRITFVPEGAPEGDGEAGSAGGVAAGALAPDLSGPVVARVEAYVVRWQRPNVQIQPRVMGLTSQTYDQALASRGMMGAYPVTLRRDEGLAARIAADIRERLTQQGEPGAE